jgi:uncharacterized protein involved in exopolysaccharide biosynthesis
MASEQEWEQISILSLAAVVLRRWKMFVAVCVASVVLGGLVLVLRGPAYMARTTVVPAPSRSDPRADLLGSRVPAGLAALAIGSNSNQRLVGVIAKSEAVRDSVVRRLSRPEGPTRSQVATILRKRTSVKTNPDGSVVVEVTAPSPRLAASIAGLYPELINDIAGQLGRQTALRKREFLESQLTAAGDQLSRAEAALLSFQQTRDVPAVQEQAEQTVEAAAQLQRAIFELELRVRRLRVVATPTNPQLREAESELAARREQLRRLTGAGGSGGGALFVPLGSSAELKLSSMRLLREFTKYEQVYVALAAAMAQTQVEVNENLPVVSVLDEAVVPTGPSGASPIKVMVLSAFLGVAIALMIVFTQEFFESARREPANAGFFAAWQQLRGRGR